MARLVYNHEPSSFTVKVPCLTCGHMGRLGDMACDLDGPAFKAYYCPSHVPVNEHGAQVPIERCLHWRDCARCNLTGEKS